MTSRRRFLRALAAFSAAGAAPLSAVARPKRDLGPDWPKELLATLDDEIAEPLGEYWSTCLETVAAKINALSRETADGFWFLTDLHIPSNHMQSGKVVAALAKRTSIDKMLCGGDFPEAFTVRRSCRFDSDKAGLDFSSRLYRELWTKVIESSGTKVYTAKGNHDFTIRHDEGVNSGFTYSGVETRNTLMGSKACADVMTNVDDPESCYYYFDNQKARIRYVVADTTDSIDLKKPFWAVVYGMHDTQLLWLAEHALSTTPAGWNIVVMHHIPITGVVGNHEDEKKFAPFRMLLEAYQNRGRWTCAGRILDFSSAKARIILDITGHHHTERQTFQKGILHVTEPCDASYWDGNASSGKWCKIPPKRTAGTIWEQTFDAVQINTKRGVVHFTRIGGGEDRVIHVKPLRVAAGEKLKLMTSRLKGPIKWGCYDADRIDQVKDPKCKWTRIIGVKFHADYATMASDGTLSGIRPGEAMAVAMDANLNKEIWPVTVLG